VGAIHRIAIFILPPLPQYVFMAWCLVKHMDKFTFTFTYPIIMPFFISSLRSSPVNDIPIVDWRNAGPEECL